MRDLDYSKWRSLGKETITVNNIGHLHGTTVHRLGQCLQVSSPPVHWTTLSGIVILRILILVTFRKSLNICDLCVWHHHQILSVS